MYHVILEMYAGGNVILTDGQGLILTLLRPYTVEEGRVAVGQIYPMEGTPEPVAQSTELAEFLRDFVQKKEVGSFFCLISVILLLRTRGF